MDIGIVGLPSAGKSTLFNAITKAGAQTGNFPFTTIDKNVGMAVVHDERLHKLAEIFKPPRTIYSSIQFYDIAGLVKGASSGEGLGNKFLSHIREVDVIAHVVRVFEDPNVAHVSSQSSPAQDIETINTELLLSDLQSIERRREKMRKERKGDPKKAQEEASLLDELQALLDSGMPARHFEKLDQISDLFLLTSKPVVFVANLDEDQINNPPASFQEVVEAAGKEKATVVAVSAKVEAEIAEMDESEVADYLEMAGLEESGLNKLVRAAYELLNLITFFTVGEKECRAWSVDKGATAPQAAGKIHSDFERGFIKAEVVFWEQVLEAGSLNAAKEKGWLRIEGKDYIVKDGDCITFRFNV